MTEKDRRELAYWLRTDPAMHFAKYKMYMGAWQTVHEDLRSEAGPNGTVLEIGMGPYGGFLPQLVAMKKVGIDPLVEAYRASGILRKHDDIEYVNSSFEQFETDERFHTILTADVLDHGDLGFHVLPKISGLLRSGGSLYLHVHLRPKSKLNPIHDHALTLKQLDAALAQTNLIERRRVILPNDIDGKFCEAVIGVWRRPC